MRLHFTQPARDPLWALTAAFLADPRGHKLDLGLGVYRDEDGATPVMRAVREAELRMARQALSKTYRPLSGHAAFNAAMTGLLLGAGHEAMPRTITQQTVGGTGALRVLGELVANANPGATVWLSNPGYVNHRPIMSAAGLAVAEYPWAEARGAACVQSMFDGLSAAREGDVLLLQGCCHNPTGIDPTMDGWQAIADFCRRRGLVPLVDMAYQGLGDGLDQDAGGLRLLASRLDTVLVAASCSKNMGLYCERTGAASVILDDPASLDAAGAVMEGIARRSYSMAADHGAAIAASLIAEPVAWVDELETMRLRIRAVRRAVAAELRRLGAPRRMLAVAGHRGMFSTLPLDAQAMQRLRDEHAIYGTPAGRINLAGLTTAKAGQLARALVAVASQVEREAAEAMLEQA